jgi:hypothetical protein
MRSNLQGVEFGGANLEGADFSRAIVDGGTLIWRCKVNHKTKFEGVVLNAARIYPATRQLLEYNVRRMNWEAWYRYNKWEDNEEDRNVSVRALMLFIRLFWSFSDYGLRTWRIILWFFGLAFVFALVYWGWPSTVMVNCKVSDIRGFLHAFYFSVVTMTTLGFGDIAANPDSLLGQTLLMFQVLLGYVLLAALVTRFAVLFTAGGPAGTFARDRGQKTDDRNQKTEDRG